MLCVLLYANTIRDCALSLSFVVVHSYSYAYISDSWSHRTFFFSSLSDSGTNGRARVTNIRSFFVIDTRFFSAWFHRFAGYSFS